MNIEHFEEWMTGLESDEYEQGIGQLVSDDGERFCCIGVGCRVAGIPTTDESGYEMGLPRAEFWDWLGLGSDGVDNSNTIGLPGLNDEEVTHFNDSGCWDFKKIAAWMRKHRDELVLR